MRFCPRAIAKNGDFYYQLSRFSILSRLLFRYVVKTVSDTVEKTSGTFRRRQIAQQRLLRPRGESYAGRAAFFVRAASRTPSRPPSSSARRVVRRAGRLLRPRGESYAEQAAFFVRAASRTPSRPPSSPARRVVRRSGRLLRPRSESYVGQATFFVRAATS